MRRPTMILLVIALLGLLVVTPLRPAAADEEWGPFRGRIMDADTGEPIAGAVFVAVWFENVPNPIQGQEQFYDARVAVTNADGRFEVPRREPPFFTFQISRPAWSYFAPGYLAHAESKSPDGQILVELRERTRLTREEQLHRSWAGPLGRIPDDKRRELLEAINLKRREMGLRPITPSGKLE